MIGLKECDIIAFLTHCVNNQGTNCMSEVKYSEQNLAYSRALFTWFTQVLDCKIEHAALLKITA